MASKADDTDYFVLTSESGNTPNQWSWEIRRKSRPMGITPGGFFGWRIERSWQERVIPLCQKANRPVQ
jgi:hypothetical protein